MSLPLDLARVSPSETILKLPHPYYSEYTLHSVANSSPALYQLQLRAGSTVQSLPFDLHSAGLRFSAPTDPKSSELPPSSNNGPWGRARRSPVSIIAWDDNAVPSIANMWLLMYTLYTVRSTMETVRLELQGKDAQLVAQQLQDVSLAIAHPQASRNDPIPAANPTAASIIGLRSTFWQGAGAPFGPRPVWCPENSPASLPKSTPLSSFPPMPTYQTLSISSAGDLEEPERVQQSRHLLRAAKPAPGSVFYSRWIPHLKEVLSMVVLDYRNEEHVQLFHTWQNDPRVSEGWNQSGTVEEHTAYLRKLDEDPHKFGILAKFDETFFAYFEFYWAKEDALGSYYDAGDWDRGRQALVGDVRFRGPHRVSAWWSSTIHYLFIDDPRTLAVVGEPRNGDSTCIMYDLMHGFGVNHFVDLPHKRSALDMCHRERFFQICPLGDNQKLLGGIPLGLMPKL